MLLRHYPQRYPHPLHVSGNFLLQREQAAQDVLPNDVETASNELRWCHSLLRRNFGILAAVVSEAWPPTSHRKGNPKLEYDSTIPDKHETAKDAGPWGCWDARWPGAAQIWIARETALSCKLDIPIVFGGFEVRGGTILCGL